MGKVFSTEISNFIKTNTVGLGNKELAELVNRTFQKSYTTQQIKTFKANNKISSGLTGYFEKGHIPQNKGKKMSAEHYKKAKATMFKKGNIPHNHRPIGSERISRDGYVEVKIAEPNKWELKHRVEWEKVNGKLPKGYVLLFLDQNSQNITLDNIVCVSRAEFVRLNQNHRLSEFSEITKNGIVLEKLKQSIRDKSKMT